MKELNTPPELLIHSFSYGINTLTIAVKNYAKTDILVF